MNEGPNQPQQPGGGNRRRRRRRGASGKKHPPHNQAMQAGQHAPGARHNRSNRRPAAFVGPMDHSYRNGQNGNAADNGNQVNPRFRPARGAQAPPQRFQPADMTPVAATRDDAPARIFCFIEDLFFLAKIQETARKLNVKVEFVKTVDPILDRIQEGTPEDERPALVIFDLNNLNIKPLTLIPKLRTKLKKGTSIIGFVSHIQGDLKLKAQEAGCDMVMPRSAFSQNLPNLLRRHATTEEALESHE